MKISMEQVFTTTLTPMGFLSNAEAKDAFESSVAVLIGVEKKKVVVIGATGKPTERVRRALTTGAGIVVAYEIIVEIHDAEPAAVESALAAVVVSLAAPSFMSGLAAAMALVPSIPAVTVESPVLPTVASVTVAIMRTPWPSPVPTQVAESEQSTSMFSDSIGFNIGLGVGAFALLLVSVYALIKKSKVRLRGDEVIGANAVELEITPSLK